MLPDSQERAEKQLALLKQQIAQRKQAEEALRRETAIVELLQEVAVAANGAKTIEAAFQFALDRICEFTNWPLAHVSFLSPDDNRLIPTSIWHITNETDSRTFTEVTDSSQLTAATGWLDDVLTERKPVWVLDAGQHERLVHGHQLDDIGVSAALAFPVLVGSKVAAILEFYSFLEEEPDEDLIEILPHIGAQLGRVMERVQSEATLRQSEQRLRQSEALLAQAERIAQLGSWQWDIEEDRVRWSDEMSRIYDLSPGEGGVTFEGFLERAHPDDRSYISEVIETAHSTRKPFDFFYRIMQPGGEVRLLHGRGQPVFDEAGELIRMVGTGQDVTDLKRTERKLQQNARQLTALNELGQVVTASLDLEDIFQLVLTTLRSLLQADGIFILLLEGDEFVFAATDEIGTGSLKGKRVPAKEGVAGEVLATGRAVWVFGEETNRRIYSQVEEVTGYLSNALLAVPLRVRDDWIGVMEAVHSRADAFDDDDLRLLEAAGAWTAVAIGNARLFEVQQRARQTAEVMRNANQDLTQSLDLNSVLASLLEHLEQLTGYDNAAVMLLERNSQLRVIAVRGHEADDILNKSLRAGSYPQFQKLLSTHQSLSVADVREGDDWKQLPGFPKQTRSCLGVPLQVNGRAIGLCLLEKATSGYFTRRHHLLAESLAGQASTALQNAKLFAEVRASRERLHYLTGKVVAAQENERRRVSRELHDQAGQALTVLKMSLEMIKNMLPQELDKSREMLAEAVELSEKTMEQIRLLALNLRPPVLDTLGLNAALQGLCQEIAERSQLSITYHGLEITSLTDSVTVSFYRFLQEALTNVVKYASANQVQVVFDTTEEDIRLTVTDDGQGFSVSEELPTSKGIGLRGVQERFEILGGQMEIDSERGRGTRIMARVPREPYHEER